MRKEIEEAQVEFEGKEFTRKLSPDIKGKEGPKQTRKVRVVAAFRPETGTVAFRASRKSPTITSDLPDLSLSEAKNSVDVADVSRLLETALKEGASTSGIDTEAEFKKRGGSGKRVPKNRGFSSPSERLAVDEIRKKKGSDVDR